MIYIYYGDDRLKKNSVIGTVAKGQVSFISNRDLNQDLVVSYADHVSLFGEVDTILFDDAINEKDEIFTNTVLSKMKESKTIFIFLERNLLAPVIKKYKVYAEDIKEFKDTSPKPVKANPFILTDLFFKRDRLGTWITYLSQIEGGESAEAISGMLFWRVKKALLSGERSNFKEEELKNIATRLVRDYHRSHSGECDLAVALEENILSVL